MESSMKNFMEDLVTKNTGVTGCLVVDNHGLCLSTTGDADPKSSGIISAIAQQLSKLEPNEMSTPVISLTGDQGKIIIKQGPVVTTAIFKSADNNETS